MTQQAMHTNFLQPSTSKYINKQPYSDEYDDVYFNDDGGLAETRYVFIESNDLIRRWRDDTESTSFCIAETGFGTGLNLLSTLQAWRTAEARPQKLHFISCEKHPLKLHDLQISHDYFPELSPYSQELLGIWSKFKDSFRSGMHRFQLSEDVELTLLFGDATENLVQLQAAVDAWYLDGFAPSKNPDMWHNDLFVEINRLSNTGTTLATFTAASKVRKTLESNGFSVTKKTGYGKKREMITASFKQANQSEPTDHPWGVCPKSAVKNSSVTILGGGIAGMCLAYYFKQADHQVTVVDQQNQPMQMASGNDLAMVMPLLTVQPSPESAFYLRAFESAIRFYSPSEFKAVGVEQHLNSSKHKKWTEVLRQSCLPKELLQLHSDSTILYSTAGYVNSQILANRLRQCVDHWITADVKQLNQIKSGQWQLSNHQNEMINQAELLVVANGIQAQQLLQTNANSPHDLSLVAKHGMTTKLQMPADSPIKHIHLADGYVIPDQDHQQLLCGATFDHLEKHLWYQTAQLHDDHWQRNLKLWQNHPLHEQIQNAEVITGHAAIRATTPDHLPICGPVIDQKQFRLDYHDLHHGRHWQQYPAPKTLENLYVMSGLGSRGFTSAPLLAQYLCAMIFAEPLPLESDLCKIIHPNRFLYRSLKKTPEA